MEGFQSRVDINSSMGDFTLCSIKQLNENQYPKKAINTIVTIQNRTGDLRTVGGLTE